MPGRETRAADELPRLKYNNPPLAVDLGVGLWAWPLPMDYDKDGDVDLVVTCPDVPYNGTYFFENPGGGPMPVFKPAVKIGDGPRNLQVSYVDGLPRVLVPGVEYHNFRTEGFNRPRKIFAKENIHTSPRGVRANQWKYADYNGDGATDLVVGVGDWSEYGWDNAFNEQGEWTNGPLHGYVYVLLNRGSDDEPDYSEPLQVLADGTPIDVFGMPSPNFADFDSDGDLDLLCGEFLDGFTYFANIGTATAPRYAKGERFTHQGRPITMDLQMITPVAVDWDGDGKVDIVCGDEDGRVAWLRNVTTSPNGPAAFLEPRYFQQQAEKVKFGALVTPFAFDWDDDGDTDLVCGNTAGYIAWIENLGGQPAKWNPPKLLQADGKNIRIQAGSNGSIQGPAEAKWGYTTLSVADWDHDGKHDIVANSIWGRVVWYRNIGTRKRPQLAAAKSVQVAWKGTPPKPEWNWWSPQPDELATQWRTTPYAIDLDEDGLNDLVMLDHEGYLAFYRRTRQDDSLVLLPPKRIFTDEGGSPLRLNAGVAGKSGRRKFCLFDWGRDGRFDLLTNGRNVDFWRNVGTDAQPWRFKYEGPVSDHRLAGHTTSPTVGDLDGDGKAELIIGAEDGFLYILPQPPKSDD